MNPKNWLTPLVALLILTSMLATATGNFVYGAAPTPLIPKTAQTTYFVYLPLVVKPPCSSSSAQAPISPSAIKAPIPPPAPDPNSKKMVVTTTSDQINGDVSSWDALLSNPGPDGISLREALTVANITPGPKEITFDPSLKDAVIFQSADPQQNLPSLTSGDLTLDGDIDHDGLPDITLDGSKGTSGNPTALGLRVWSSNNQVNGLHIQNFADNNLVLTTYSPTEETTKLLSGNRFTNNQIDARPDGMGIVVILLGPTMNDYLIKDTTIAGNTIHATGVAIMVSIGGGASRNQIIGTVIQENVVSGADIGIGSADTDSTWHNGFPGPAVYSTGNLIQDTLIQNNRIDGTPFYGIQALTANMGNYQNRINNLTIVGNTITHSPIGIHMTASEEGGVQPTRDNLLENVVIEKNIIDSPQYGIFLGAAEKLWLGSDLGDFVDNRVTQATICQNAITNYSTAGIEVWGGRSNNTTKPTQDNRVIGLDISNNTLSTIQSNAYSGILLIGGLTLDERGAQYSGPALQNALETVSVSSNQVRGGAASIRMIGGRGQLAEDNHIVGLVTSNNQVDIAPVAINNDAGASGNTVEMAP